MPVAHALDPARAAERAFQRTGSAEPPSRRLPERRRRFEQGHLLFSQQARRRFVRSCIARDVRNYRRNAPSEGGRPRPVPPEGPMRARIVDGVGRWEPTGIALCRSKRSPCTPAARIVRRSQDLERRSRSNGGARAYAGYGCVKALAPVFNAKRCLRPAGIIDPSRPESALMAVATCAQMCRVAAATE